MCGARYLWVIELVDQGKNIQRGGAVGLVRGLFSLLMYVLLTV